MGAVVFGCPGAITAIGGPIARIAELLTDEPYRQLMTLLSLILESEKRGMVGEA